jgi:SAM-dependent methyltransferase
VYRSLLDVLVDPVSKSPLQLKVEETNETGGIIKGTLVSEDGSNSYPIINGIPRFVAMEETDTQAQTAKSFGFKWAQHNAYEDPRVMEFMQREEPQRYGVESLEELRSLFLNRGRILDAGCGSGHYSSLYLPASFDGEWVGTDLTSGIDIAQKRVGNIAGTNFVQADIFQLPYQDESFDLIFSRGVMHHTPSTERAFNSLARLLKPGGEFIFLVYRKNGPIREFTDDHIRASLSTMSSEEAWEALKPLTKLGQALTELRVEVEVPEDIPYLGIEAGRHDIQRFIYNYFLKAYWNEDWTLDESNLISFDWYHPKYAFRHTEEEVHSLCAGAGLSVTHLDSQWTGFTVRAVKDN